MPLTASVESGQSSPSLSTGGGVTAAVGVAVGGGACGAGGTTGDLTSGFSPGSGVGAAALVVGFGSVVVLPVAFDTTTTTTATMMATTRAATPMASIRRRR